MLHTGLMEAVVYRGSDEDIVITTGTRGHWTRPKDHCVSVHISVVEDQARTV